MGLLAVSEQNWQEVKLGDIAEYVTVGYVGPMAHEYLPAGIPFLRSQDIKTYRIDFTDITYISEEFHERIKKSALQPGDVVIVRTGRPGTSAVIPETLPISNCSDLVVVRPGSNLDSRYLCYYINSIAQDHVSAYSVGAVQQHYNVGSAKELKLLLPPLSEQRSIVRVLGALDDKIELNRRMNHTLEEMARALFKSWFVDFDPVIAKAEGRIPFGLKAETASLFPAEFEETPDGTLPKGWKIGSLGKLFPDSKNVVLTGPFGSHLHAHDYRDQGVPLILVKHVNDGYISEDGLPLVGEHKVSELQKYLLKEGDIVFTRVGAVGRSAYVHSYHEGWMISGQMLRVRLPDSGAIVARYLAQVFLEPDFIDMVEGHAVGTTRPSLNTDILLSFKFLVPSSEISTSIHKYCF